jgi:hypothetical protein
MNMAGFTAEASLYNSIACYRSSLCRTFRFGAFAAAIEFQPTTCRRSGSGGTQVCSGSCPLGFSCQEDGFEPNPGGGSPLLKCKCKSSLAGGVQVIL